MWNVPSALTSPARELTSIVAVKASTGEYAWHYQHTPADDWDYDSTNHIILADLKIDGKDVRTLADVKAIHESALGKVADKHRLVVSLLRNGERPPVGRR